MDFAGVPLDSGFGPDTVVKITEDQPRFGDKVGADGEVTRYRLTNRMVNVEITFMQSSDANALLSAIQIVDDSAPNGAGVGILLIKDEDGTSKYLCPQAWIAKRPDVEFGVEVTSRTWVLRGRIATRVDGGN
jgi:hypothetical protein